MPRNWKAEYQARKGYLKAYRKSHQKDNTMRKRAARSVGKVPAGHEVDHIDSNPRNNAKDNLRIVPRKVNRAKGARKTNAMR
jgi:hypothetical protein